MFSLPIQPVQIIFLTLLLWPISRLWLRFKDRSVSSGSFVFWMIIWVMAFIVVLIPQSSTFFANELGIGRGSDLIAYIAITILFYLIFRSYVMIENLRHEISTLVRQIAMHNTNQDKPKTHIACLGLPVRKNKQGELEYLLTKRYSPKNKDFHDKWQLAGGGLEFGETPEEGMIRELKEEIDVDNPKILFSQPQVMSNVWWHGDDDTSHSVQIILITYIVDIDGQETKIVDPDHETSDMDWFTLKQVEKLEALPKTIEFVRGAEEQMKGR